MEAQIDYIILCLGKALDHAVVYGYPTDRLREAYQIAINLKSNLNK